MASPGPQKRGAWLRLLNIACSAKKGSLKFANWICLIAVVCYPSAGLPAFNVFLLNSHMTWLDNSVDRLPTCFVCFFMWFVFVLVLLVV